MATATKDSGTTKIRWKQQARQMDFLRACGLAYPFEGGGPQQPLADVIFYGGAAGGGKSDALLILGIIACVAFSGCQVGYFRREYTQLEGPGGAIMRSKELYGGIAKWNGQLRRWTFPAVEGKTSIVQFCHAKNEGDIYNYQSQQFDVILIDESTHFTRFQMRYLLTRNRATTKGVIPFTALGSNPGNVGHGYHKREFVDPGPPGQVHLVEVEPGEYERHLFIPAFLQDNQVLELRDPGYRGRLQRQGEEVRKALLEGDWNIFSGQYFKAWRQHQHVCEPFHIPKGWTRFRCMDWGYRAPCSVLWCAVDPSMMRVIVYREIYVTQMRPNQVADLVLDLSQDDGEIAYNKASPDIWQERGLTAKAQDGESIGEVFDLSGLHFEPADNRRIMGWSRVRDYLTMAPDGRPYLLIFNNCTELIRTLPELIHDERNVEDVSDKCEDHAPEALRYGLMSRPSPIGGDDILVPGGLPGTGQQTWDFDSEEGMDDYEDEDLSSEPGFY